MTQITQRIVSCLVLPLLLSFVAETRATIVHDEETDGDFSGIYTNPTPLNLAAGVNSIIASTGVFEDANDLEYVRINLPAGHVLSQLILNFYSSRDDRGFIGLQSGPAFTFEADDAGSHIIDMLGWSHFGPAEGHTAGTDLLPILGENGQGFDPPLKGSTYTFWIQQTGAIMDYRLDFVVEAVPEPTTAVGLVLAMAGAVVCGRWRRSSDATFRTINLW